MAEPRLFKPLKDVGAISLSDATELRFYVDEYRGHRFASIRSFVKSEDYNGPTKSGVTFGLEALQGMIEALEKLSKGPALTEEKELARFAKRPGLELVLRVTVFKGATGLDIREWVAEASYKGWSRKGVRLPYSEIPRTLGFLKEMRPHLEGKP